MRTSPSPSEPRPTKADWTILAYMSGKNDLAGEIRANLRVLEKERSGEGVALAVQAGFIRKSGKAPRSRKGARKRRFDPSHLRGEVIRYAAPPGKKLAPVERLPGKTNMGYSPTLEKFLEWGIERFPARRYLLIINNHGGGFLGISRDHQGGSTISLPALRKTLETVKEKSGVAPDILLFDACLMGQAEVLAQIGEDARFVVASEEQVAAQGIPWKKILGIFKNHPSPETAAREIVQTVRRDEEERKERRLDPNIHQYAALRGGMDRRILHAMDHLAGALLPGSIPAQAILETVKRTRRFDMGQEKKPNRDFRDAVDFAENLMKSKEIEGLSDQQTASQVKEAARELKNVVRETVLEEYQGKGMKRAHGLSVYLPTGYGRDLVKPGLPGKGLINARDEYSRIEAAQKTRWEELLKRLAREKG